MVNCQGTFSAQETLVKFKEGGIDVMDVVIAPVDEVHDDHIKDTAAGQRKTGPSNEILCLLQIQLQRDGKGDGRSLGGLVGWVVPDFGEMLTGNIGPGVYGGVLFPGAVNELQQCF